MKRKGKTSLEKFLEAYSILAGEVYIPERYREGYIRLMKKIKGVREDTLTKLKLLQYKIDLDKYLDNLTEEIYKEVNLNKIKIK